jgi:alpha-1,6-mannosyltransferase
MTRGRVALALTATSLALVALTAFLGNSVASRGLGPHGLLPPYALSGTANPWLVVALLVAATVAGTAGLWLATGALGRGWAPDPRRLLAGGIAAAFALLLVPPVTSDDLYSYTAYGRMVVLHRDPYTTSPNDLGRDPVAQEAGEPWRDSPTVYGPVATAEHALAMKAAGPHVRTGAALLALASALAFAGTAVLLYRAAADDAARRRTALLWTLNPLVLTHLVAGAHVDALLVLLAVAAVVSLRRYPLLAGVLGGAACCVKLSGALVSAALAWTERRRPRRLATLAAGAVLVAVPAYLAAGGWTALTQVRKASRYVSFGSPWRALSVPLDHVHAPRAIVTTLSLVAVALLVRLLARALPGADSTARTTAVVTLAWLVGATYVLPWYDAWLWPFLALLPGSRWDRWLAVRTGVLTVAYLPGRLVPALPAGLAGTMSGMRLYVTPVALGLLAVTAVRWCRE